MSTAAVEHGYSPRPTTFLGVRALRGWRIRVQSITLPDESLDVRRFETGLEIACEILPQPPIAPGRVGVGFAICHQGRGVDYLVLCWWARENEMPLRIFVNDRGAGSSWRSAQDEESICVWDIDLIKRERDLYVQTILRSTGLPDVQGYLGTEPCD